MEQLSPVQRDIVRHPPGQRHLLVLAAPGSGKTRVVIERVGSLLGRRLAEPEQVLVMTFTIKAATELIDRLGRRLDTHVQGVWAGTFHSICDRLLHEHGKVIGWAPPFTIYDTIQQEAALRRAAHEIGWILDDSNRLREVKDRISQRKRLGLASDAQRASAPYDPPHVIAIDEWYRHMLADVHALDYDDLILKGIQLLQEDQDTATIVRNRFQNIFVDEFHDLSPEQFTLLAALAPPRSPYQQVMVVADPNQAIYGWRQADAARMLAAYTQQYRPQTFRLAENYRSTGNLVRAAQHLLIASGVETRAVEVYQDGYAIDCVACSTPEEEARWLAKQIQRAQASGHYRYSDIAVLYRTHKRADLAEATLLQAGVPLTRVQPDRFFDHPDVQSALRYLALVAALKDDSFEPALNWPRVLVDELTMIHLRDLAQASNCSLSALARAIDSYAPQVSPLTRTVIKDFLAVIGADLLQIADRPIQAVVDQLLTVLNRRRSPFLPSVRTELYGVLEFLAPPLVVPVAHLHQAIAEGRPVALRFARDIDSAAAGLILAHILTHYLNHPVDLQPHDAPTTPDAFVITLGAQRVADEDGFGIVSRNARTITYSISTQAWRLGQMLLMRYETLRDGRFILYDLETTGHHANTTEMLELAALEVMGGQPTEHTFHSLVRPKGIISPDATKVHSITLNDVRGAPTPAYILPQFLAFLGDATLVGHNIEQFDHPVLRRIAHSCNLPPPANLLIDTCTLARRLLPGESHRMEDLAHHFGIQITQTHRALDDVQLNAEVYTHLLDLMDRERELDIGSEVLPLVALGIRASGVPLKDENAWLAAAGARALGRGLGTDLCIQLHDYFDDAEPLNDAEDWLASSPVDNTEPDQAWDELSQRWRDVVSHYCATFTDHSLPAFLHYAALASAIDYRPEDDGRVTMMTIHTAKGMEWPLVFIIGAEDGTLPSYRATQDAAQLAEERRVLYVGMTRAKQRLLISWAENIAGWSKRCCRFLDDMPADLVKRRKGGMKAEG